jgi:thioester reductase-like protein
MIKIFLTGVTGLVGSSFVTALCNERKDVEFVCLTRGGRNSSAQERVAASLREQCDFEGDPENFESILARVKVIDGDVVGIVPAELAAHPDMQGVSVFFHCAADVNLGKDPTGKTFAINFHGTEKMLALAKLMKIKEFHYVSTAYVAGRSNGVSPEAELDDHGFNNPYEESKFKAEKLVRHAGIPFTIYRPAIITGRRGDGRIRKPLAFYRILEFLAKLKSHRCSKLGVSQLEWVDLQIHFKTVPSERVYFVPIDFVQEAITALFQKPVANQTYHVTGDSPVSTAMIEDALSKVLRLKGLEVHVGETAPSSDDKLMERFLGDLFPYFSAEVIFDQQNIRRALGDRALNWPYGQAGLEAMMKSFFQDFFPNVEWLQTVIAD